MNNLFKYLQIACKSNHISTLIGLWDLMIETIGILTNLRICTLDKIMIKTKSFFFFWYISFIMFQNKEFSNYWSIEYSWRLIKLVEQRIFQMIIRKNLHIFFRSNLSPQACLVERDFLKVHPKNSQEIQFLKVNLHQGQEI